SRHASARTPGDETRPMVLLNLDLNVAVREQTHIVQKLPGRNRPSAGLLHPRRTCAADPQLEIGSRQHYAFAVGLYQDVRQDGNRRLPLDHPLRQVQFPNQLCSADREFHGRYPRVSDFSESLLSKQMNKNRICRAVEILNFFLNYSKSE